MTPTIDMTAEEFFNGIFNMDWMTEEEKQAIYSAAELFAEGKAHQASLNRQGWTMVEDGLPDESEWVLAYCKEDREHFERCCVAKVVDKEWFEYDGNYKNETSVTHWMPLPNKPSI